MTRRRFGASAVAMASALFLAGCGDDRFPDYRYKMTIYVDTPEGTKSFASVRQVKEKEVPSIQNSSGWTVQTSLRGEAVILDLPGGRTAYALLTRPEDPDYAKYIIGAALRPFIHVPKRNEWFDDLPAKPGEALDRQAEASRQIVAVKGAKNLPRTLPNTDAARPDLPPFQAWPMFVTFGDPADPKTVREVTPDQIGVKRITIEITDEPVTTGIERRLPSFGPETGFKNWISTLKYGDPILGILSGFSQGQKK